MDEACRPYRVESALDSEGRALHAVLYLDRVILLDVGGMPTRLLLHDVSVALDLCAALNHGYRERTRGE